MSLQETILESIRKGYEVKFRYFPEGNAIEVTIVWRNVTPIYTLAEMLPLRELYHLPDRDDALEKIVRRSIERIDLYRSGKKPDNQGPTDLPRDIL